jgi:hypothetical protein
MVCKLYLNQVIIKVNLISGCPVNIAHEEWKKSHESGYWWLEIKFIVTSWIQKAFNLKITYTGMELICSKYHSLMTHKK